MGKFERKRQKLAMFKMIVLLLFLLLLQINHQLASIIPWLEQSSHQETLELPRISQKEYVQ